MESEAKSYNIATLHLGVKPYACTMCDKRFFQRYHLARHSLTHMGMRPPTLPMSLSSACNCNKLDPEPAISALLN